MGVDEITACGLVIRPHEHIVVVDGHEVDLTFREFEIVMKLVERPGWVYSPEQLATDNEDAEYSPESVTVLVSRLRHKLAEAGASDCIETVRGLGYRIHAPRATEKRVTSVAEEQRTATLREASWSLLDAVLEVEHSGTEDQRRAAIDALETAQRTIRATRGC